MDSAITTHTHNTHPHPPTNPHQHTRKQAHRHTATEPPPLFEGPFFEVPGARCQMPDASSTDQQIDKHTGTHRHTDTQTRRHTHSLVKKQANKQTNTYRQGHRHTATEPPKQIPDGRWQTQNPYPDADRATRIHQSPMGKPDQEHTMARM